MSIFEKFRLGFKKSANKISEGFREIVIKKEISDKKLTERRPHYFCLLISIDHSLKNFCHIF